VKASGAERSTCPKGPRSRCGRKLMCKKPDCSNFLTSGKMGSGGGPFGSNANAGDAALKMVRSMTFGNTPEAYGAIRVGKWKLIVGHPGRGDWYGTDPSPAWAGPHVMGPDVTDYAVIRSGGPSSDMQLGDGGQARVQEEGADDFDNVVKNLWLFDLEADPTEKRDLSAQHPEVVSSLQARLAKHRENMAPPLITEPLGWPKEKRDFFRNLARNAFFNAPGSDVTALDWWVPDDGGGGRSRL